MCGPTLVPGSKLTFAHSISSKNSLGPSERGWGSALFSLKLNMEFELDRTGKEPCFFDDKVEPRLDLKWLFSI